jgi:hypothetical protein
VARGGAGNALGGLQLSQHSVPTATNTCVNAGAGFCVLFGTHIPFTDEELRRRYPGHGACVSKVARATNEDLRAGFLVPADAALDKAAAEHSEIGKK